MPKSKVWLSGKLQPSAYPTLKRQNTALGLTLPVWWYWGGAGKDPAAPALAERGPSLNPKVEETESIPTPDVPPPSKPRRGCLSRRTGTGAKKATTLPPGFALCNMDDPEMPPLEDVYGSLVMPIGSSLDFTAPESLQVTYHILL